MGHIQGTGLTLNWSKCNFCESYLQYLEYIVNAFGLIFDPENVGAILRLLPPKTVSDVRRIVGLASWYRGFVKELSLVKSPMTALLRKAKQFIWDEACRRFMKTMKKTRVGPGIIMPELRASICDTSRRFVLWSGCRAFSRARR
ncbi:hypothetical protein JTB14_025165 [Gonioctena quinquepunctata]|nr:hypothetical protein JTB14_025165 [Gonioctena quinquepunctata]